MIIKSIELRNFRNYENLDIHLDEGTNILYGDNAQGKTNILEAAYLSGTTKSHKGSRDKEMIRFGEKESHIRTDVQKKEKEYQIDMHLRKSGSKGVAVNKIPIKKASELFGILNIVFFSPEDLNIIKNGPAERRRFIDMELSQLDKVYLNDLANYNRIINQRNKLLKDIYGREDLISTLDIWDMQMAHYGDRVMQRRAKFIAQINGIIENVHGKLTGGKEKLNLFYEKSIGDADFSEAILKNRERDIRMKSTSVGPHRDDICFKAGDLDIRKFGSQGQQRTAALSLKLSEIELVKLLINDTPILLLDDVLSELDKNRQNYLLDSISNIQTIVTCTGVDEFVNRRFLINKIFHVNGGQVKKEN